LCPGARVPSCPPDLDAAAKKLTSAKNLPSSLCFRRFLDVALLTADIASPSSLISKRLTGPEQEFVLQERLHAVHRCVNGYKASLPYLYTSDPEYLAHAAADYKAAHEASLKGPYQGVKAPEGHH
jgi:hypothetical protein